MATAKGEQHKTRYGKADLNVLQTARRESHMPQSHFS